MYGNTYAEPLATAPAGYRELDQRSTGDGATVSLYWQVDGRGVALGVTTADGTAYVVTVPADRALDAFYHPFVYLPRV